MALSDSDRLSKSLHQITSKCKLCCLTDESDLFVWLRVLGNHHIQFLLSEANGFHGQQSGIFHQEI